MGKRTLAAVVTAVLVFAGCGDDGEQGADTGYDGFCQADLAVEKAVAEEDPGAIETAFASLASTAPAKDKATVDTTITEAKKFLASDSGPSPEFDAAYADLIEIVQDHCGFADLKAPRRTTSSRASARSSVRDRTS